MNLWAFTTRITRNCNNVGTVRSKNRNHKRGEINIRSTHIHDDSHGHLQIELRKTNLTI